MSEPASRSFDNVLIRVPGSRCIVASVAPPFVISHWPKMEEVLEALELEETTLASMGDVRVQEQFLSELADQMSGCEALRPATIGFPLGSEGVRLREQFRSGYNQVTFVGQCPRQVLLGTLEALAQRVGPGGKIHVQLRQWDPLRDWPAGREQISDVLTFLQFTNGTRCSLIFYSALDDVPNELWQLIYDRPCVRVGWVATDLAGCSEPGQFQRYQQESLSFKNLESLASQGLWPHVLLPVSAQNTKLLPELVLGLVNATRGGTICVIPTCMMAEPVTAVGPSPEEYAAAIMTINRDGRIPLQVVAPQSWVAARIDADAPMIASAEMAGAALTVLANGDIYAGEYSVGIGSWRLGNILEDEDPLHWERLDALAETYSNAMKPAECQTCDWRYRCGGLDSSVLLIKERCGSSTSTWEAAFQLYCQPRKRLFEEAIWDSVDTSVQAGTRRPRELIELHKSGIDYVPAPTSNLESIQ